jgi:hypothetical protein
MDNSQINQSASSAEGIQNNCKEKLQELFKASASPLYQLYTLGTQSYDLGYAQGKQDAYEEVFKWFTYQHDNSLRYVSTYSFFSFINEKL